MSELTDQIEAARAKVAHCRIRAERPTARLEDEFALEKARNRLLTLELRQMKLARGQSGSVANTGSTGRSKLPAKSRIRTKSEHSPMTARERAEAAFAALGKTDGMKKEVL